MKLDDAAGSKAPPFAPADAKRRGARVFLHAGFLLAVMSFAGGNLWIAYRAHGRVFTSTDTVPFTAVALVLGTSARGRDGGENPFFAGRMAAAAELYGAGKVRHLILSGDDRREGNDEPREMQAAVGRLGVPAEATTLDAGGFRTVDSVARAKQLFGVTRLTIVTDDFHAERAILLARHFGVDACAYTSRPVSFPRSKKTRTREIAARLAALLDLYVLRTEPNLAGRGSDLRQAPQ